MLKVMILNLNRKSVMKKFLIVSLLLFCGCTNANQAQLFGYGSNYKVTLYSGDVVVEQE